MIYFLAALCLAAPLLILFVDPTHDYLPVTQSMRDLAVLPRLAATATFTGGALIWGAALLASERWPAGRWPATLWGPVVAFVVVNFLALLFAVDWRASLMGETFRYQGLAATLLYVLLFAVTAVAIRTTRDLRWLLLAVFAGALGAAGYALVQKAGLDWIPWSGNSVERPFGTMGQANVLGAFLVAAISSVLFLVLTARERWQQALLSRGGGSASALGRSGAALVPAGAAGAEATDRPQIRGSCCRGGAPRAGPRRRLFHRPPAGARCSHQRGEQRGGAGPAQPLAAGPGDDGRPAPSGLRPGRLQY